ncbi:MAG: alpha/beta fold hydrolase [Candidatus Rokuibacteriota bacterium]
MPKVRVGDIDMFYVEAGEGAPLVLIMGFTLDHTTWRLQIPVLSRYYRVIAFDNRGVGQTDAPDHPCTVGMMANDTVGLMNVLGIERAHLIAVSMGGRIAQELTLNHADRVRSLHLGCSTARRDAHPRVRAFHEARRTLRAETMARISAPWFLAPATFNHRPQFVEMVMHHELNNPYPQSAVGLKRQAQSIAAAKDSLERLETIRCPTLVSVGEDDILMPPHLSREIAERIPGADFRVIPRAGHLYFLERPDEINELCLEFLAKH